MLIGWESWLFPIDMTLRPEQRAAATAENHGNWHSCPTEQNPRIEKKTQFMPFALLTRLQGWALVSSSKQKCKKISVKNSIEIPSRVNNASLKIASFSFDTKAYLKCYPLGDVIHYWTYFTFFFYFVIMDKRMCSSKNQWKDHDHIWACLEWKYCWKFPGLFSQLWTHWHTL